MMKLNSLHSCPLGDKHNNYSDKSGADYSKQSACTNTATTMLLPRVAKELEMIPDISVHHSSDGVAFPMACRSMLYSLPGNSHCADCGMPRPEWASVSYGILICLQCSGRHRSFGVKTSFVRSVEMDTWSKPQVLAMLEGGNRQLQSFFERHQMGYNNNTHKRSSKSSHSKPTSSSSMVDQRYQTKAALFYRSNLKKHAENIADAGVYKGRDAARGKYYQSQSKEKIHQVSSVIGRIEEATKVQ